jgi:hypothetical protein
MEKPKSYDFGYPIPMHRHLPRLARGRYTGFSFVHWTLAVDGRATGWLDDAFHARWREIMLHTMARYGLVCPAYTLMPDHAHVVWLGIGESSSQRDAMKFFRGMTSTVLSPHAWQRQAYDHVLTELERGRGAFAMACAYVFDNPRRGGLANDWREYPFVGAMVPGFPTLDPRRAGFWELFWKVYNECVGG